MNNINERLKKLEKDLDKLGFYNDPSEIEMLNDNLNSIDVLITDILQNIQHAFMLYNPKDGYGLLIQTPSRAYCLINIYDYINTWDLKIFSGVDKTGFIFITNDSWKLYKEDINSIISAIEEKYKIPISEFSLDKIDYIY